MDVSVIVTEAFGDYGSGGVGDDAANCAEIGALAEGVVVDSKAVRTKRQKCRENDAYLDSP